VPLLLGETGEATDDRNVAFRKLNESLGIGWSFWTYKNMESDSTVVSIAKPQGWDKIALLGGMTPKQWPGLDLPSPEAAKVALDSYLDGILLKNGRINRSYLASLGFGAIPKLPASKLISQSPGPVQP